MCPKPSNQHQAPRVLSKRGSISCRRTLSKLPPPKKIIKKWEEGWARGLFSFELTRKKEKKRKEKEKERKKTEKKKKKRGGGGRGGGGWGVLSIYKNTSLLQADVAEADTAGIRHASLGSGHGGFGRSMSPAVRCRD